MVGTRVLLVRHGETDWNAQGRWQGHEDVPLNGLGTEQARLLAGRLAAERLRPAALVASDLRRAFETARLLGEALGLAPEAEPALRELDVGRWRGLTLAEVSRLDPQLLSCIEAGEDLARGGGESMADLRRRVGPAFDRLVARQPGGLLLLVSHGGPTRALLQHALPAGHELQRRLPPIGNASLTLLEARPGGWELLLLDDRTHLRTHLHGGAQRAAGVVA
jgi:broad specificity phosphatase PhoE